jgi:hypothetical protein
MLDIFEFLAQVQDGLKVILEIRETVQRDYSLLDILIFAPKSRTVSR